MNLSFLKSKLVYLILFCVLSSCYTKKDIVYFQNAKNFETIVDTDTFKAKLKIGDLLGRSPEIGYTPGLFTHPMMDTL